MDVDHNQIETHMSDPAMHNTDVRPNFWRDPNEQEEDHASPYSTGGDAAETALEETSADPVETEESADSKDTATNDTADPEPVQLSNDASHQANALLKVQTEPEANMNGAPQASLDPSVPAAAAAEVTTAPNDQGRTHPDQPTIDQTQPAPAFSGNVDVQALLDTLQVPPAASTVNGTPVANGLNPVSPSTSSQPPPPGAEVTSAHASGLSAAPPGALPARPPPQEQPLIHPNYVHSQHIRDYHPHAAHSAFQPQPGQSGASGNVADPSSRNYVPPVYSPSSASGAAAQTPQQFYPVQASPTSATPTIANNFQSALQTPISAQGYPSMTNTPIESRRESKLAAGETPSADDRPWDASIQAKYDRFIEAERGYVSEGRWEQFPQGSRLFVGNLSSEKVTKRDIFHVFHSYGELAQVSIKQAYGFVQFLRTEDCARAMEAEQGTWIRDKKIHLEVSKPQKNRNQNQNQNQNQQQQQQQGRRSRSPADYGRGKPGANVDRYVSGRGGGAGGRGGQQNGYRGPGSFRSPSPPRGGSGYRDRYDDRGYRARSPDYGRGGAGRYRSPSPQRRSEDDDLPLPKRAARDVPDVQIIVLEQLDRDFISWVENAFSGRGVRVDVLLLSPRLSEQAVIRRQIVEGVVAVTKLTTANQNTGKIGLQIFDRRGGAGSVKFEEYDNLDPGICAELVIRAKGTHAAPPPTPASAYGGYGAAPTPYAPPAQGSMPPPQQAYGAYGAPPPTPYGQQQPPPQAAYQPPYAQPQGPPTVGAPPPQNLQNLITSLDPSGLQNLLSAMNQGQSPNTPQTAGSYGAPQSAAYGQNYGQQQQAAMEALQQNPGMVAGVLQQQQQQQQAQQQYGSMGGGVQGQQQQGGGGGQVNMQDILARLGTYKQ
ncbi:hypothetical protein LTR85_010472 [Meristemomyces frigidus]|nr:hypothetical protein LTR85_010472 [Meristemomyces frigidus]